jgi:hypothetical protein
MKFRLMAIFALMFATASVFALAPGSDNCGSCCGQSCCQHGSPCCGGDCCGE